MEQGGALRPTASRFADSRRHGLRIDSGSLRSFVRHVGLLPGRKAEQLAQAASLAISPQASTLPLEASRGGNWDRVVGLRALGRQQVFDLSEPATQSFVANGITVHNCSEYMFLDDTACNLASLNVLSFFDAETRHFDIEAYRHAIRLWTIVLEISVLMASFPSEEIARLSYRFRTLGLGYANLGAMLAQACIPYDSDKARAICAALTSILTGESYATSAEMSRELGAFPAYEENRQDMLRVMRNHRRAAYDVAGNPAAARNYGGYEGLEIPPVGIDASQFAPNDPLANAPLLSAARECWDRALCLGERHGYRNAQVSVIAPTGTIGLLMDCDTTGVEPDFALVKFKKLAGGGYFKITNQSLRPALVNLGYSNQEIHDILRYVMGTLTFEGAPHINRESLRSAGFTGDEVNKIEESLPSVFELSFAFSPGSLDEKTLARLGIGAQEWESPSFNLLQRLGFSRKQIADASALICGRGTVEGAPHLRQEHLSIFDCANRCGKTGKRFIPVEGHIRMMAAAQPFITGAISKTINLPNEATLDDIRNSYFLSWKLGLKANALYRDGSKLSQPLNVKSDEELDKAQEDDEENVKAARDEVARDVASAAAQAAEAAAKPKAQGPKSDNLSPAPMAPIEKIIERIVERPLRRRLPDTRRAITHKFDVAGHEGYITVGLYDDGAPGEMFITMAKEGSTIGGLMDTIATLVSVALQYGVPVESLVRKFEHVRFEPSGMTRNNDLPFAKSLVDYIFRWLAMEFIAGYKSANAPQRSKPAEKSPIPAVPAAQEPQPAAPLPALPPTAARAEEMPVRKTGGNGHGPRIEPDSAKPFDYAADQPRPAAAPVAATSVGPNLRLAVVADPLSQQSTDLQSDAPACDVCGSITVRSGTCYKCLNCGNSMGCS
jgi:ribonucleoside-diphosphate reductase alpha chain